MRTVAGTNAGTSRSDLRDMLLDPVEARFGDCRAPARVAMLSDNGSANTKRQTRVFAAQTGLKPRFAPWQVDTCRQADPAHRRGAGPRHVLRLNGTAVHGIGAWRYRSAQRLR